MADDQEIGGISRRRRRAAASRDFLVSNLEQENGSDFLLESATLTNPQFILLEN
jgi:hypothetical protein